MSHRVIPLFSDPSLSPKPAIPVLDTTGIRIPQFLFSLFISFCCEFGSLLWRWLTIGPEMYITAAKHFYRALKVYPNTPELLDIYKKTVPQVRLPGSLSRRSPPSSHFLPNAVPLGRISANESCANPFSPPSRIVVYLLLHDCILRFPLLNLQQP